MRCVRSHSVKFVPYCTRVIQSGEAYNFSSPHAAGLGGVDEDVVLAQFLNVGLNLVHLAHERFITILLAEGVVLYVVGLLLVLNVEHLPLLLEGSDKFLSLSLGHEELLAISFCLFFNLHLAHHIVFILNLSLDLANVLGDLTEVLLFEVVTLLLLGKGGRRQDGFNGVGHNKILVTHEAVNWALILLGDGRLDEVGVIRSLGDIIFVDEYGITSTLLLECLCVGLELAFLLAESGSSSLVVVRATLKVELAGQVGANGLAGSSEAECA